jgi:hypothetical protein
MTRFDFLKGCRGSRNRPEASDCFRSCGRDDSGIVGELTNLLSDFLVLPFPAGFGNSHGFAKDIENFRLRDQISIFLVLQGKSFPITILAITLSGGFRNGLGNSAFADGFGLYLNLFEDLILFLRTSCISYRQRLSEVQKEQMLEKRLLQSLKK